MSASIWNPGTPVGNNADSISYQLNAVNSSSRTVADKLDEIVTVKDFAAVGNGVVNDTLAFTKARTASGGRYHIPSGTYVVDPSPDVWADSFTASPNTFLIISGVTYNISNAFLGPLRYVSLSNALYGIKHAITENNIQLWQNGNAGTATYFYRTLSITANSHFLQAAPATNGGSTDLLFQRSTANADPAGNRFNITFEETGDRLLHSYATTASGAPSFDTAMQINAGTSPALLFPALPAQFNQGVGVKQRAAGGFEVRLIPTSSTVADIKQIGGSGTTFMSFRDAAMGFFGSAGTARPNITGSRGGNVALANLLTALDSLGLITNSTTA